MESSHESPSVLTPVPSAESAEACVPELVHEQAARAPEALAIASGSQQLTYRELDQRSNQLARYLQTLGVGRGSLVGVYLERSIDFPLAALAILKAGGAYLPLDSRTPAERLNTMLEGARVPVLVTQSKLADTIAAGHCKLLVLDRSTSQIAAQAKDALAYRVNPHDLAYVIYTSGSTGAPKAVQVGHDNLLNLVRWHIRAFAVTAKDRATQLASIGFDAAAWELWAHLAAGSSLHIVDDATRTQPDKLRDFLVRENIAIAFVPTPLAEQMVKLPWPEKSALRFLLTGADTLRHYPPAKLPFTLVNNYGPTECTVVATSAPVSAERTDGQLPPIGRPIDGTEAHVFDSEMRELSPGQVGELYIGGAGVSRGYLNDPELTAARFINDPLHAGKKVYRTGDLVSRLPDGQISFHGRVDDQVKIRGYRIELNEVAAALLRHPAVRESFVVANRDGDEKRLLAYIVPQKGASPSMTELRGFLAGQLPEYMLPAAFIMLEVLPIGPNGKVDRSALISSDASAMRDEPYVGPTSPTEERISAIVARLLSVDQVGVHDNFFLLGGNSLLGTQVIAQLRSTFGVEVSLLELFDHPTVGGLAEVVEQLLVASLDAMSEEEAQRRLAALGPAETKL